jgi:mutator protein MutT
MMQSLDTHWREHLAAMDYLRQGIHLRSYAQKNPKQEYKREAFELFTTMLDRIKHDTVSMLSRLQVRSEAEIQAEAEERQRRLEAALQTQHAAPESLVSASEEQPPLRTLSTDAGAREQVTRSGPKVGRNDPCPCGSGKKYKHCHGALEARHRAYSAHMLPLIHVVAGALLDGQGQVLIAQRPAGKHMAGGWEFPGGKLHVDETPLEGLRRELVEELGITVQQADWLASCQHDYPDRRVLLELWTVTEFTGQPQSLDGQAMRW